MQTPLSSLRLVAHALKIIAILKLTKLALRHPPTIMTRSLYDKGGYLSASACPCLPAGRGRQGGIIWHLGLAI
jgi:hypothetical protein